MWGIGGGRSSVQLSWSRDPCSPRAGALVACRVGPLPPGGRVRQNRRPEDLLGPSICRAARPTCTGSPGDRVYIQTPTALRPQSQLWPLSLRFSRAFPVT